MLALVVGDVAPHSDREKLVVNMFSVMSTECVGWCICMVPLCSFTSVNTEQRCGNGSACERWMCALALSVCASLSRCARACVVARRCMAACESVATY
jgi:hypothetical protein